MYHAAKLGRLGRHKKGRYVGAWCARHNNKNQWFKVDFGRLMKITKIAMQGRQDAAQWVTYYRVSSSVDRIHWQMYRFKNNDMVRKCDTYKIFSYTVKPVLSGAHIKRTPCIKRTPGSVSPNCFLPYFL